MCSVSLLYMLTSVSQASSAASVSEPSSADADRAKREDITKHLMERRPGDVDFAGLEELLRRNPSDFRIHFALARAYETKGMYGMADQEDEFCEKAGQPFKDFILKLFKERIDVLDYAGATALFRYVEKNFPDDPSVLFVGAMVLDRQGRLAEAIENLNRAIERKPDSVGVFTLLGSMRMRQGQYEEAVKLFDAELSQHGAFNPAIIGKGKASERLGRYTTSLKLLSPIYREDPLRAGLPESIADCLIQTGNWAPSATPALFSIATAPKYGELQHAKKRIGVIWPRISPQERERALQTVVAYLRKENNLPRIRYFYFAFGDALQKSGFWREAKEVFQEGLRYEPDHGRAFLHLGEIAQYNEHDYEGAINNYQKALEYIPANQKVEVETRQMLELRIKRLRDQMNRQARVDFAGRWRTTVRKPARPQVAPAQQATGSRGGAVE